jgi:hypothetical protein
MRISKQINFALYKLASKTKAQMLNSLPISLIPKHKKLDREFQIAITTYVDRYETFFKPLYFSLRKLFPEVTILVAVNGFHDSKIQKDYLERFYNEICMNNDDLARFILHDKAVGLTRLWNELLSQSKCDTTLILNDDLQVYPWLRSWMEGNSSLSTLTLINASWSHFFLTKEIITKVGWFDEEFHGIGFEDMDYTARCALKEVAIANLRCQHISHLDHQPLRTSFDDKTDTLWGPKYSSINHQRFFDKWKVTDDNSGIYIKQLNSFVIPNHAHDDVIPKLDLVFNNGVCYPDR